jgi:predicted Rossmann-fold nucleotide-binding protein
MREGNDPNFKKAMYQLGYQLARQGVEVVLGKYQAGLLKDIADGVARGNGKISLILVEEDGAVDSSRLPSHITIDKYVPEAQHEDALIDAGDAFIAGHGGMGTFADLARALTRASDATSKAQTVKPIIIYGENNPLQRLFTIIEGLTSAGLADQKSTQLMRSAASPSEVLAILGESLSNQPSSSKRTR